MVSAGVSTALPPVDEHYLCGGPPVGEDAVLRHTLALAVVTYRAPKSLRNSLESWRAGGLLELVDERMMFINGRDDGGEQAALAAEYGFDVYTTDERGGNVMAAGGIAYLAGNASADSILFKEKDFILTAPDRPTVLRELHAAVHARARGVDAYRLRGRTDFPAEGMPDCCAPTPEGAKANCPYHDSWSGAGYFSSHQNWLRIFCAPDPVADGRGQVVQCTSAAAPGGTGVDSFAFSGGNSNWSNNPVIFGAGWFTERLRGVALSDEVLAANNMFEFRVMMEMLPWRPAAKYALSLKGIFTHMEVDQ
jgi:hypothetical protein